MRNFITKTGLDIDALLKFHRSVFGDARMETATLTPSPALIQLRSDRDATQAKLDALLKVPTDEKRGLTDDETTQFTELRDLLVAFDERISDVADLDRRAAEAAAGRVEAGDTGEQRADVQVTNEPNPVYRNDNGGPSFFADLAAHQTGRIDLAGHGVKSSDEVRQRLAASQETRAGDMTTVAGAGGEFAPPAWFISDFVALARAGRVTADLCQKAALPSGISSINLPKVSSGTTVAVQQTQNSALSDTAMTTTSVSSGITTLAGLQIVAMQLLQQSPINFDSVILEDLALAYAVQVDTQVLYGTNANGQVRGLVGFATNNAFTTAAAAPASVTNANSLYYITQKAAAAVQTGRFMVADAIVMHPNRWAWILGATDANARPFVIPDGNNFNPLGTTGEQVAQGPAGHFGSYPVYTDPNISTTANSTTNQDEIYVLRSRDLYLWESPVQQASFDATFANNASILYRVLGYMAFIPNRYGPSVQSIRGTGLVAP